jgi:hypothetical protein
MRPLLKILTICIFQEQVFMIYQLFILQIRKERRTLSNSENIA